MKKLIMLIVVLSSALIINAQTSYQVYRNGSWQIAQSGTQITQGETYALYQNGTLIGSAIATNTFTVAAGTAPAPSGCSTCPPPVTSTCNTCPNTTKNTSETDEQLKKLNNKMTYNNVMATITAGATVGHWVWDMATGKDVWVNGTGGGINPPNNPGGPNSWGGDAR